MYARINGTAAKLMGRWDLEDSDEYDVPKPSKHEQFLIDNKWRPRLRHILSSREKKPLVFREDDREMLNKLSTYGYIGEDTYDELQERIENYFESLNQRYEDDSNLNWDDRFLESSRQRSNVEFDRSWRARQPCEWNRNIVEQRRRRRETRTKYRNREYLLTVM